MERDQFQLRAKARAALGTLAAKAPATPIRPAEPLLIRTGDIAGKLTFLGVDIRGRLVCQCVCGVIVAGTPGSLLAEPLKPQSRRRLPRRALLACAECQRLSASLTSAPRA